MTDLSLRLSSHSATPTTPQSAGLVERAQPIRTLAIKLEDGVLEEGEGGGCETQGREEAVEEAEEQLEVTHAPHFHRKSFYHLLQICHWFCPVCCPQGVHVEETLSSLVASMGDPTNGSPPEASPHEETSRHYSSLLGQEELQQELVVKAIKVKKRSRRQQGKLALRRSVGTNRFWSDSLL